MKTEKEWWHFNATAGIWAWYDENSRQNNLCWIQTNVWNWYMLIIDL